MDEPTILRELINEFNKIEKECIDKILEQAYKRPPVNDDYKNLQINFLDEAESKYAVLLSGIEIGIIYRRFTNPFSLPINDCGLHISNEMRIEFIPHTH